MKPWIETVNAMTAGDIEQARAEHRRNLFRTDRDNALLCLAGLDPAQLDYADWLAVGMALKSAGASVADWEAWSRSDSSRFKEGDCAAKWATFKGSGVGLGSLIKLFRDAGGVFPPSVGDAPRKPVPPPSPEVSIYSGKTDRTGSTMPLGAILDGIRTGRWAALVAHVRDAAEAGADAAKDAAKGRLPGFTPSGRFTARKKDGLAVHSGVVVADLDHLPSREDAARTRDALAQDAHVVAAFVSPSGRGVKALVRVDAVADADEHAEAFAKLVEHFAQAHGVKLDTSGKDVSRLCFVSHDPDAFIREGEAEPLAWRVLPPLEIEAGDEQDAATRDGPKPWQQVSSADARAAIRGSLLEQMVSVLQGVADPPLPLEITLPKALVLAACALSQKAERPNEDAERGIDLAKLSIEAGGGLACNVWACVVAPSGCGKDIGNLPQRVAQDHGLYLGNGGSAEGVQDALAERGAGLLMIPELQNYLDSRHWQNKTTSMLTAAFNAGSYHESRSKRVKGGGPIDIPFCFPNLLANVQPEILAGCGGGALIDSGFLPRFLFAHATQIESWRPVAHKVHVQPLNDAFDAYLATEGRVAVPPKYLQAVMDEFVDGGALFPSHYSRLINEYSPKLAVMLAVDERDPTTVELLDRHWERAGVLVRWFYGMAEGLFVAVSEDAHVRKMESRLDRMLAWLKRHPKGVLKSEFSKRFFERGTTAFDRDRDLAELEARGRIVQLPHGKGTLLRAVQ